jgi:hypothetical protein
MGGEENGGRRTVPDTAVVMTNGAGHGGCHCQREDNEVRGWFVVEMGSSRAVGKEVFQGQTKFRSEAGTTK